MQSFLVVQFCGSREPNYFRIAFVSAFKGEKVVFVPCQVHYVCTVRISLRKFAPLDVT